MKNRNRNRIEAERAEELVSQVSQVLFEQDPMRTCCVENDAFDEYDSIAQLLVDQLTAGDTPYIALRTGLATWFGEELVEEADLAPMEQQLEALMASDHNTSA